MGAPACAKLAQQTGTVDFGVMEVDGGRLVGFREKPKLHHTVSMGGSAFGKDVLRYVPADRPFGLDHLMLTLPGNGVNVRCKPHDSLWLDIGRADHCDSAQAMVHQLNSGA